MSRELTVKQEAFKEAIITNGGNATEAAKTANYCPKAKNRDNKCGVIGHGLLRNIKIKEAIAQRKAELSAETGYTVAQCQQEYEQARTHAATLKQPSAEVSAITGKARLFGFDKDASADKGEVPDQLSEADLATLRAMAKAITDKGLSGPQLAQGERKGIGSTEAGLGASGA